jgi:thiosulfate/3-mercaptopyruvate sulfurtransferase
VIEPVVSPAWLAEHLDVVVVADARSYLDGRSGREAYARGHLPGAVFVDVGGDLSTPPSPAAGRHPLPEPEDFATAMARLGIGDDDTVIAYDDAGGSMAARLVWMLRVTGRDAALLDGGIDTWPGGLTTEPSTRPPARFTARPWPPERLATIDEAARAGTDGAPVLVDARAAARYRGEVEPLDPRAGHIPGAVNLPHAGNLDESGRWLPPDALRRRFEDAGVGAGGEAPIVYCGSGVTACHDLLALERAGLGPGRLFPGSWSQWSNDPDRPAATGANP